MPNSRLRRRTRFRSFASPPIAPDVAFSGSGDFGAIGVSAGTTAQTFTVSNVGAGVLSTSGLSVPSGFTIVEGLSAAIAAGGSDQFTVRLDDLSTGIKDGNITFSTNDPDETSVSIPVSGEVTAPVSGSGGVARWSMTTDFGTYTREGATAVDRTLRIYNASDDKTLSVSGLAAPSGLSIVSSLPSTIAPLEWADVTIRMATSAAGSKGGNITLSTNDPDSTTLIIPVSGAVVSASGEVLLRTETRRNKTGPTVNKPPIRFLLVFEPGELPTTDTLVLRKSDETLIATTHWQWGERSTHEDGSLRACVVRCYGPSAWADNTDYTVKVYKTPGSWPAETNSRTITDVTSNSDREVRFLNVRAAYDGTAAAGDVFFSQPAIGSGTFYNSVNDDLANASVYKRTAGGVCTQWYCYSKSRDLTGDAEDADLKVIHYLETWNDPDDSSAVKWISWEPIISNGQWHDSGTRSRSVLYALEVYEAGSSIRNWRKDLTLAAADVSVGTSNIRIGEAPIPNLVPVSRGALIFGGSNPPGGITAGKYYSYKQSTAFGFGKGLSIGDTASTSNGGPWNAAGNSLVNFSSNGGGTFTISCRVMHPMGRFYPLREDDGFEHWIMVDGVASTGAGPKIVPNWSEAQILERQRAGQLMPIPIRTMSGSLSPAYNADYETVGTGTYAPWAKVYMPGMSTTIYKNAFDAGSVDNATGDSTQYGVDVLRSMTSLPHHKQLRLMAADWPNFPNIRLYDGANNPSTSMPYNRIRPSNNGPDRAGGSYSGMNTPRTTLKCGDASNTNDYIVTPASHFYGSTTGTNGGLNGGVDGTHTCPANIEAFALYASPADWHFSTLMAAAAAQYVNSGLNTAPAGGRNRSHAGTTYYHVHAIGDGLNDVPTGRANAQIMRFMANAILGPDSEPESLFFQDVLKDNYEYAEIAMTTPAIVGPVHKALGIIGTVLHVGDGGAGTQQGWFMARWLTCTLFALKRYGAPLSNDLLDFYSNSVMGVADRKRTGPGRVIQAKPHMLSHYLGWQYLVATSDNTAQAGGMDDSRHNAALGWSGMAFTSASSGGNRIVTFRTDNLIERYETFPTTNDAPPYSVNGDSFHLAWYPGSRASLPTGLAQSVVYYCYDKTLYARVARVSNYTGSTVPAVGVTMTQGGNTATIVRAQWAFTGADYFIWFTPPSPGTFTAGAITFSNGFSAIYPSVTYDGAATYKICTDYSNQAATRVTWTAASPYTDNRCSWRYTALGNSPNGWSLGSNSSIDYAMQQFNPAAAAHTWFRRKDVEPIFLTYKAMMSEARGLPNFEGGTYRNNYYQALG